MALTQISTKGIKDGTILNADINASAAIAGTKIGPNFGSQNIVTTGNLGIGITSPNAKVEIASNHSQLRLKDTDDNKFCLFSYSGGKLITRNNSTSTTTAQFTLDESGRLGIGTISPNQLLEVANSSGGATISISTDEQAGSQASKKYNNLDFTGFNNNVMARIQSWDESSSTGHGYLTFFTNKTGVGFTEKLRIDPDGNVGIGTTSPEAELHVEADTPEIRIKSTNANVSQGTEIGRLAIHTNDPTTPSGVGEVFKITSYSAQGNGADYGTKLINRAGSNSGESVVSLGQGAVGAITFSTNTSGSGLERMRIDSIGNVGIGTTSPVNNSGYGGLTLNGNNGAIFSFKDSDVEKTRLSLVLNNLFTIQYPPGSSGHLRIDQLTADGSGNITGALERIRVTSDGNTVFRDKDSGHIGGGFYSRTKSVTGSTTVNFMRFTLTHGALAGSIYATASNNAYSISKSYSFAVQYGDGSNVNIQSDSGPMGGVDFIVSCSTSASTHTFRVQNTGSATIEVNLTVIVGCANQDITYTEL